MATPNIPPRLGYKVTYRNYSWLAMVTQEWGEEWRKPDTGYEWSDGRKFDCSDQQTSGIYRR